MRVGLWSKLSTEELMLLNCGVGEYSWESLGLKGGPTSLFWRSALGFLWREWYWSWNSSTLATSCEELTLWKRLWCWEGLGAGGEGDDRGWDGWMASPTQWTWVRVDSGSWWSTGKPGVLRFMQELDMTERLNWTVCKISMHSLPQWAPPLVFILQSVKQAEFVYNLSWCVDMYLPLSKTEIHFFKVNILLSLMVVTIFENFERNTSLSTVVGIDLLSAFKR